jgi:hypothetical protein
MEWPGVDPTDRNIGTDYALRGEFTRRSPMKWTFLILCAGFFITTLVLFIEDYQIKAGVERLSEMRVSPQPSLYADPNLKLVSEQSPYMRDER